MSPRPCPCDLPRPYAACCGRFHAGADAPTAVEVMRARYAAYALADEAYLIATWDPATAPSEISFDPAREWLGLNVADSTGGTVFDDEGTVTFIAEFVDAAGRRGLSEVSRFRRDGGRWLYVDAIDAAIDEV